MIDETSIAADSADLLAESVCHHQAGRRAEAERGYRRILQANAHHPDALHLLGVIAHQDGNKQGAVALIRTAIAIKAGDQAYYSNLGLALKKMDRATDAVAAYRAALCIRSDNPQAHCSMGNALMDLHHCHAAVAAYRAALCLKPDFAAAHANLGNTWKALGCRDDAVAAFDAAVRIAPDYAEAYSDMGLLLKDMGRLNEAVAAFGAALRIKPGFAQVHFNLAVALKDMGRLTESIAAYRAALGLKPDFTEAYCNLGSLLRDMERPHDAVQAYRAALCVKPDHDDAHYNMGNLFYQLDRLDAARAAFGAALVIEPDYAEAHCNLGNTLVDLGRFKEGIAAFDAALRRKPDYADAYHNRGLALLSVGQFEQGWRDYEWRWQRQDSAVLRRNCSQPQWQGEDLDGRVILLYAEQGLGDTIQFSRYVPLVAKRGGRVILEAPRPLLSLFHGVSGVDALLAAGDSLSEFEVQCPLMSLPGLFGTAFGTIPPALSIAVDSQRAAKWKSRLRSAGHRIGIVWQGNPKHKGDRHRSVPLATYAALGNVPGADFISLQKGFGVDQIDRCPEMLRISCLGPDYDEGDFAETACVLSALDLVISIDSAVAHLAGTMGVPTWVILPFKPDWRWLLDRDDTPWYPTMRLFRQTSPGDWHGVFEHMALELRSMTARAVPR